MKRQKTYLFLCVSALCAALTGCLTGCSSSSSQTAGTSQAQEQTAESISSAENSSQTTAESNSQTAEKNPADNAADSTSSQENLKQEGPGDGNSTPDRQLGVNGDGNNARNGDGSGTRNGGRNDGGHGGGMAVETDETVLSIMAEGAEKFQHFTFEDPETGISLDYALYIPEESQEESQEGSQSPLLMFIPDATAPGKTTEDILQQYFGADIWVTDEEQEKHPSFVLVPNFSEVVVNDGFTVSDEVEAAVNLIHTLTEEYPIDTNHLYTTGQSMGCMTSLYSNSKYPDLFAASLFVSGQWDISVLQPLEEAKFFYITASGDEKASGGQDQVMAMFDDDGISYSYGQWSAQESEDAQNASTAQLLSQGQDANFIRFELGTVLKDGNTMEHMASFNYGYRIPAVRDWLFAQSRE